MDDDEHDSTGSLVTDSSTKMITDEENEEVENKQQSQKNNSESSHNIDDSIQKVNIFSLHCFYNTHSNDGQKTCFLCVIKGLNENRPPKKSIHHRVNCCF